MERSGPKSTVPPSKRRALSRTSVALRVPDPTFMYFSLGEKSSPSESASSVSDVSVRTYQTGSSFGSVPRYKGSSTSPVSRSVSPARRSSRGPISSFLTPDVDGCVDYLVHSVAAGVTRRDRSPTTGSDGDACHERELRDRRSE